MTLSKTYNLLEEPRGESYQQLIHASLDYGDQFLLVINSSINFDESVRQVMDKLNTHLLRQTQESEWPGTKLIGGDTALVSRFSLCTETAAILSASAEGLFDWLEPELPEDLCIFRSDGSPWLVSISHERDAFFVLTDEEKKTLVKEVPGLTLVSAYS